MRKYIFAQERFYLKGILNDINEKDTSFLDCKNKHDEMRSSTSQIRSPCTVCLPIEFHGFTIRINSKGHHSLVPGLITIFVEMVWVSSRYLDKPLQSLGANVTPWHHWHICYVSRK